MTDKPWLQHYMEGVPAQIDLEQFHSVVDILEQSCEQFRDRPAFENFGTTLTFGDLDRLSRNFAATLQARGLKPGDRIALMMPNILQYPVALFGALRAGLVVVNTNPMYTKRELRHQLVDSGARAIVVVDNFANVLEAVLDEVPIEFIFTTAIGDYVRFPKGAILNFVLKHVRKAIPAYSLPTAERLSDAVDAPLGDRQPHRRPGQHG